MTLHHGHWRWRAAAIAAVLIGLSGCNRQNSDASPAQVDTTITSSDATTSVQSSIQPPPAPVVATPTAPAASSTVGQTIPAQSATLKSAGTVNPVDSAAVGATEAAPVAPTTLAGGDSCSSQSSPVLRAMCLDPGLRNQDRQITSIFNTLASRATPDRRLQFAQEQQTWKANLDSCGSSDCVEASYRQRLHAVTAEAWTQYNNQRASDSPP